MYKAESNLVKAHDQHIKRIKYTCRHHVIKKACISRKQPMSTHAYFPMWSRFISRTWGHTYHWGGARESENWARYCVPSFFLAIRYDLLRRMLLLFTKILCCFTHICSVFHMICCHLKASQAKSGLRRVILVRLYAL